MESQDLYNIIIATTVILVVLGLFIFLFMLLYQKRKTEYQRALVTQRTQFQNTLLHTQLEIQEQTFKTISQEIHDNIGQMLSLAKLNLSKYAINPATAAPNIAEAESLVSKAVNSLRDLSKTLNTDTISRLGLLPSIELELEVVGKATQIETTLQTQGTPVSASPEKELIIFRIVQEALHNVLKHAGAGTINVTAVYTPNQLHITITDNGCGIAAANLQVEGSGLRNMQSRAAVIGATWRMISAPEKGTTIQLTIPLHT